MLAVALGLLAVRIAGLWAALPGVGVDVVPLAVVAIAPQPARLRRLS